jgi:hypothetical protein
MRRGTASLILDRVRARARRRAAWMARQWAQDRTSPDQGLSITEGEVARLLQPAALSAREAAVFAAEPDVAALAPAIAAADAALARNPFWAALCTRFALPKAERDLLCLALAEALAPAFGRVLAYLQDDGRRDRATAWLAAELFGDASPSPGLPRVPEALLKWRLIAPVEPGAPPHPATPYRASLAVLRSVAAQAWIEPSLDGMASWEDTEAAAALPMLHRAALDRMLAAARGPAPMDVDLLGAEGTGRRILCLQCAASRGKPVLSIDCAALRAAPPPAAELVVAALRAARMRRATLLWRRAELLPPDLSPASLVPGLAQGIDMVRALPPDAITGKGALGLALDKPAGPARLAVWHSLTAEPPPPVVTTQRLTPAEIALVARAAPAGPGAIRMALRRTPPPDGDLMSLLPCPYGWDDLVAASDMLDQLRALETQIRLRWEVYEDWGFASLAHLGSGITALFAGSSGTGKTMAAQILAASLELDLYRVDLAGVINKYIGETEKRLRDVFAFAEQAGKILFFDEADALFGSRMQVKDSHDRFANIEIDYLLQRIERFDGIAILATNRKSDIDTAFLRRLRVVVDFHPPGPQERLAIWRRALPAATPSGAPLLDAIDWELLSTRLALTGADIKSAALGAAFMARGEGSRIGMRHVLAASQREFAKRGQVLRLRPAEASAP